MKTIKNIFLFISLIFAATVLPQNKTILKLNLAEKKLPFGLIEKVPVNLPKVGLALSGGGARSISQLGVLRVFKEKNIPIEYIVGTSMGSIIGGLYSAGYSIDHLDSLIKGTKWDEFFSPRQSARNELFIDQKLTEDKAIITFRMDGLKPILPTSLSSGQRAANYLNLMAISAPLAIDEDYDLMKIKFRAISSDLISGKEIIIGKGSLGAALRASSSVTLLLPPVKKDSMLLVDGGLVSNIPVKETRSLGADIVVAVNSSSPLYNQEELELPWNIADQLVSIPMRILNNQQLEEADFVIEPNIGTRKNTDFEKLDELILEGYNSSLQTASKIERKFQTLFNNSIEDKEIVFSNLILNNNATLLDKQIYALIENKKVVTNKEILYALYKIQKEGYWSNVYAEVIEENNACSINVIAEENEKLSQIHLEGAVVFEVNLLLNKIAHLINKPFNAIKTLDGVINILEFYKQQGYSFAKFEKVWFDELQGALHLKINEGIISKITVEGNSKTNERLITREFPLKVGDHFKYNMAQQGLTNLRSTNLFDQIELSVHDNQGTNEVVISITEKISSLIRFGFRIDNENQAQVFADIRDENFNGTGTEIGATLSGGIRARSFSLEQRANRVFDSYLSYKVKAFYEFSDIYNYETDVEAKENEFKRNKTGEYRQTFYGGSFGIGTQVERFGNLFLEARYQRDEIANLKNHFSPIYKTDISTLRLSMFVDSQNEYPYPTKGFLIKSYYETAQAAFGGDIGYTKFFFDYRSYFGLRVDHVWCFRTMIGAADNTLPLSQQFSLGGQNTFFGLRENEFRGRQVFLVSLDVRYKLPVKLFFDTYVKLRYDLGSTWSERKAIRLQDLLHGVGLTVSFDTPIGPADFSVGKSFYIKNTLPKSSFVWGDTMFYFTIGYYY